MIDYFQDKHWRCFLFFFRGRNSRVGSDYFWKILWQIMPSINLISAKNFRIVARFFRLGFPIKLTGKSLEDTQKSNNSFFHYLLKKFQQKDLGIFSSKHHQACIWMIDGWKIYSRKLSPFLIFGAFPFTSGLFNNCKLNKYCPMCSIFNFFWKNIPGMKR